MGVGSGMKGGRVKRNWKERKKRNGEAQKVVHIKSFKNSNKIRDHLFML